MRFTLQDVAPFIPEMKQMSSQDLAEIVQAEVESERAFAALAALFHRAQKPQILNYREYLKSDAWQRTRERKLAEAGRQCSLCSSRRHLQVHHRTYERVGKERLDDLVVLCRRCHLRHHGSISK